MGNGNIIAFCGRKESGKTELANICQCFGYEKISFATPLKHLISELISCDINKLNEIKNVESTYVFGDIDIIFISNETEIPISIVKEKLSNKLFTNVRQLLQYIGTDLIRKYNPNWHIERLRKIIEKGKKYVIDDVRFNNEVELINELNGDLWFVIRPKIDNISNHESENTLKWQNFDNIIVNDRTLEYLKFNWHIFMENGYSDSLNKRNIILNELIGNKSHIELLLSSNNDFTVIDSLFINKYEFIYDAKFSERTLIRKIECVNGIINVHLNDGSIEIVTNPFIIEDLKMFL